MRSACKGHLYITMNTAIPVDAKRSECRYVQTAKCLVCGYLTAEVDADFFVEATPDDIEDCLTMISQMMEDLQECYRSISELKFRGEKFLLPADLL
jgi:hypothetical protein